MPSDICVHFSKLVDRYVTYGMHTPHITTEHTRVKIIASTLEHQVLWGDTSIKVVGH